MPSLHRPLLVAVLNFVARPWWTLIGAAIVVAACVIFAMARLNISTDQNKLFDPDAPFFRDYLRYIELFPENEAIYVLIEPADPSKPSPPIKRWTAVADAIAERVRPLDKYVRSVDHRVPIEQLGSQGLLFDTPQLVQQNFAEMKRFMPLAKLWGEKPGVLTRLLGETPLERFIGGLNTQKPDAETAGFVAALAESWVKTLRAENSPLRLGEEVPDLTMLGATDPSRLGYYYVPDRTDPSRYVLLVRIYHRTDYTSLTAIAETVEAIRGAVREAAKDFPEFRAGVTGRPALEADEMRTSDDDSRRAEVAALIAIFIGLVVMLRSVWLALAGEIALGVGIGWTFGWATLSVGELNLLSMVFMLALIGIGMDYLVQILTRYREQAARRSTPTTIWTAVVRQVAAPINTACAGAAGAFLVAVFTDFRGAAHLGIIAGGGLMLCLLAGYVVLPALLTVFPVKPRKDGRDLGPPAVVTRRILLLPVVWVALCLAGAPFALRTGFDPGLIELQARNLESVKLVNKLETWSYAILSKDLNALRRAHDAVKDSLLVERTESVLTVFDNYAWLKARENELPQIEWAESEPLDANDLSRLAGKASALAERFDDFEPAATSLGGFAALLNERGKDDEAERTAARLTEWQKLFIDQLKLAVEPFHPRSPDLSKLPRELTGHFVAEDGTYALYAYPKEDLWHREAMSRFVQDIESRTKEPVSAGQVVVTGIIPNIYYATESIAKSFYTSTFYALGLIFVLVLIDLRSVRQTLLAISVLAFGLPVLVAIDGLIGVNWNFANFFGLPILIGAGHEYGVFLVHRYREAVRDPRRVWRRWDVADKGLLLCAYVTCTSFGFFALIAQHRGLRSLGMVMAIGTACIYLAAVLVLRPVLLWRLSKRAQGASPKTTPPEPVVPQ